MAILAHGPKTTKPPPAPAPVPPPPLTRLTAIEAGALLGVSRVTVYAMAKQGKIPAVPVGVRSWRFFREPLIEWQAQQLRRGLEVSE